MLENKLSTSNETINLFEVLRLVISLTNEKVSRAQKLLGTWEFQPARIYGLPKMHKVREPSSAPPFRPIVSSIGTYNYNLAKFLCTLLNSQKLEGAFNTYFSLIAPRLANTIQPGNKSFAEFLTTS